MLEELVKIYPTYKETLKNTDMEDKELKEYLLSYIQSQKEIIEKYQSKDVDIVPIRWMRSQSFIFVNLLSLIILTLYIAHNNLVSTGIPESITYIAITTLELCSLTFLVNYIFILLTLISSSLYFKVRNYTEVDAVVRGFYTVTSSLALFFLSKLIFERYDKDRIV